MEIRYDVDIPEKKIGRGGDRRSSPEVDAIIEFLASDKKNICFSYETDEVARIRRSSIARSKKNKKLPIIVNREGNKVYVEKEYNS